ncbi:hypothetical protein ACWEPL_33650 [Nonomuraea sp. NPDC004186]
MADAQVPWGVDALGGAVTEPAWRHKPSWYLVATEDRMIPPPASDRGHGPALAAHCQGPGRTGRRASVPPELRG